MSSTNPVKQILEEKKILLYANISVENEIQIDNHINVRQTKHALKQSKGACHKVFEILIQQVNPSINQSDGGQVTELYDTQLLRFDSEMSVLSQIAVTALALQSTKSFCTQTFNKYTMVNITECATKWNINA